MTNKGRMDGRCLCGSVSIGVPEQNQFEACHCSMCSRWGGGPLLVIHCGDDVQINGAESISTFDSSDWAERAFCKSCGTHLYYKFKPANQYSVSLGLFQDHKDFTFSEQIFIDNKPDYYEFANDTVVLTEAEVIAKYTQQLQQ